VYRVASRRWIGRDRPSCAGQVSRHQPWDVITTFVTLGYLGEGMEYGSWLLARALEPAIVRVTAFRFNARAGGARRHAHARLRVDSRHRSARAEQSTYEFPIGPPERSREGCISASEVA
jgi:hypothetical protein